MQKNLEYYVLKKKKFLSPEICNQIIEEMNSINFEEHTFYNPMTKEYKPRSGSQEFDISWENTPTKKIIMDKLWFAVRDYLTFLDMPWFQQWNGYSELRLNKYSENKKMALHCDHIRSMFDGERKGVPILSILGVLNDDFEGGEFIIFQNEKIEFEKGDVIIFPSNFLYPHKVEPVKKGTRYSFISWVW